MMYHKGMPAPGKNTSPTSVAPRTASHSQPKPKLPVESIYLTLNSLFAKLQEVLPTDANARANMEGGAGGDERKVGVNLNIMSTKWVSHSAFRPYRVSMMKFVTGAFRGSCEWAQDKSTERDVKLTTSGRPGGSGTSVK
uniref:Uncharacterized protein n=1 Tax=Anopheles culicifacies TaxID=139723 RepID=A0A182MBJ9_9DIPT